MRRRRREELLEKVAESVELIYLPLSPDKKKTCSMLRFRESLLCQR